MGQLELLCKCFPNQSLCCAHRYQHHQLTLTEDTTRSSTRSESCTPLAMGTRRGVLRQVPHTDVANFVHFHCFSLKFVASCGSLVAHGTVTFEQLMLCPRGHISTLFFHTANICIQVFTAHTAVSGAEACKMMWQTLINATETQNSNAHK